MDNKLKAIYFFKYNSYILKNLFINKLPINNHNLKKHLLNHNLKKSGYFNKIEYIQLDNNKSKYFIAHFQINPVLKKISIHNYKNLRISKKRLVNILKLQLGLPVNSLNIENSLNKIIHWYKSKGYLWIRVYYNYLKKNNILYINILEGKITQSYCMYNENILNIKQQYKIIYLNNLIKKELSILPGKILNINNLELNILKIKKKYCINQLKYKIKYNENGLIIIIKYNLLKHSQISINYNKTIINKLLNNLKIFNVNELLNTSHKIIIEYFVYIYKYISHYVLDLNKKLELYYFNLLYLQYHQIFFNLLVNIITNKIIIISLFFINSNNILYKLYNTSITAKIIVCNIYFHDYLFLAYKDFFINYFNYSHIIKKIQYNIKLYVKYFNKTSVVQSFIYEYYIYNQKICIIHFNEDLFKSIAHYSVKNILQRKKNLIIQYHIKIKYNYFNLITKYYFRTKQIFNLNYSMYIQLNATKLYKKDLFKYYFNNIEINYQKFYQIPKLIYNYNLLKIFARLHLIVSSIKEELDSGNYVIKSQTIYNLKNRLNTILRIEYQMYINKHNFFYLYCKYTSLNKLYFIYLYNNDYPSYYNNKYNPINLGIGIQINTPITYMPNIKVEIQYIITNQYLIRCYFKI